ncbi:MAG: GatB/YqeY domain-containing protein [Deltaproteobacteria bacterium]|nr:MAG: GatB/YqeY domain-containing protein [Deltaproteobacteria bacterium]
MSLHDDITSALREAMRAKDKVKLTSLRLVLTGIKNKEKDLRRSLKDEEVTAVVSSQIKQRREAIEQYRMAGRDELAAAEEKELQVLQNFMPEQLSEEQMELAVDQIISEVGAVSMKDMGKVMKVAMARLAGRADGRTLNTMVKAKLAS